MKKLNYLLLLAFLFNSLVIKTAGKAERKSFRFNQRAVKHCEEKKSGDESAIDACICGQCWHSLEFENRCMGGTDECTRYCKCVEPPRSLDE